MFFTKEDRRKLDELYKAFAQTENGKTLPKLVGGNKKAKEETIKVGGGTDLSSVADEEQEIIREQVAAKLSRQEGNRPFYEEEFLSEEELEAIE